MDEPIEIGPLQLTLNQDQVWFKFSDPMAMMLEIPPTFEDQLREITEDHIQDFKVRSIHLDLDNLPAISSRQLGMILTIREAMKPFGPLQLHHISNSVRHFLKLTGTERLFKT